LVNGLTRANCFVVAFAQHFQSASTDDSRCETHATTGLGDVPTPAQGFLTRQLELLQRGDRIVDAMDSSNYDLNVQLALATTAEHEGDLWSARAFLMEARRMARMDRVANARIYSLMARLLGRRLDAFMAAALAYR
jgi:hypothetical protein